MVATAKNNHVFLMEAFWTKFLPQFGQLQKVIQSGEIGALKMIQADFGFRAAVPPPQRLYDPRLGGGALLDIGIYPVFLAVTLLGRPVEVNAVMSPYPSQVDEQIVMNLKFGNDELAVLSASFAADTPVEATIIGTKGYIRMQNRFHNATSRLEVVIGDESREISVERESGHGYQYEARHVGECLRQKLSESPVMTFSDSMLLIETLDRLRRQCGIKYESDNT
jgi:predicted dehydrogenase